MHTSVRCARCSCRFGATRTQTSPWTATLAQAVRRPRSDGGGGLSQEAEQTPLLCHSAAAHLTLAPNLDPRRSTPTPAKEICKDGLWQARLQEKGAHYDGCEARLAITSLCSQALALGAAQVSTALLLVPSPVRPVPRAVLHQAPLPCRSRVRTRNSACVQGSKLCSAVPRGASSRAAPAAQHRTYRVCVGGRERPWARARATAKTKNSLCVCVCVCE